MDTHMLLKAHFAFACFVGVVCGILADRINWPFVSPPYAAMIGFFGVPIALVLWLALAGRLKRDPNGEGSKQ
jgi:hypothetical protein